MKTEIQHQKTLTISIAAYNSEKYLAKCLDSLVSCRKIDKLEIFVINDGSTDSTQMIAEQYQRKAPGSITVISKENGGHGSTINCSINRATGKYFRIVDADDWVDSEGIDRVVSFLEQTTADLILNPYTNVNTQGEITRNRPCIRPHNRIEYGKEYEIHTVQDAIDYETHMIIFRTEILKRIREPMTEHCYYVDVEYILYPIPYVQTIVFLDYVLYRYLFGIPEQSVSMRNMIRRRNEHMNIMNKAIQFYDLYKREGANGLRLIHTKVVDLVRTQYMLYFKMKDTKTGKEEAVQFDRWLKENSNDLYHDVLKQNRCKTLMLLKLLRKTDFHGYRAIVTMLHALGLGVR